MRKLYHTESALRAGWSKHSGFMRIAGLVTIIGLCVAAVFVAKAQTGKDLAGNDLNSSFYPQSPVVEKFFGLVRTPFGYSPKWLLAVEVDHTGEWQTDPPPLAFRVSADQEENTGVLSLLIDRSLAGENLVLELTYEDAKGSLYIGLSSWPEGFTPHSSRSDGESEANEDGAIFPADLFGNIMQGLPRAARGQGLPELGHGGTVTKYFEIPIQSLAAQYLSVDIYRGKGEISLYGAVLYTRSEFNYWLEQALVAGVEGLSGVEAVRQTSPERFAQVRQNRESDVEAVRQNRELVALPAEQIATAVQLAASLMITHSVLMTRSVLDGSGGRMASPTIILESSFGQGAAIGFSYGSGLTLLAGYQQGIRVQDDSVLKNKEKTEGGK